MINVETYADVCAQIHREGTTVCVTSSFSIAYQPIILFSSTVSLGAYVYVAVHHCSAFTPSITVNLLHGENQENVLPKVNGSLTINLVI